MPRKTIRQRKSAKNRITILIDNLKGTESADDIMIELMDVLKESKTPSAGSFYVFVYNAKTPNIRYDQNPLVAVTNVFNWGFSGFNYHWGEVRHYTWNEVAGGFYEVYKEELEDLKRLPFGNIRLNS